jgi:hypothetical protein
MILKVGPAFAIGSGGAWTEALKPWIHFLAR